MSSYQALLNDWAELSLDIENGVTITWSVKSVGPRNLPFLKFRKKLANFGQLCRSLKIWVGIVPYDGYQW